MIIQTDLLSLLQLLVWQLLLLLFPTFQV